MRVSKHPTEETKAVGSEKSSGALRSFDNETYSLRTPHARCIKTGKGNSNMRLKAYNIRENLWSSNNHRSRFECSWEIHYRRYYKIFAVINIGLSKTILRALVLREILSTNSLKTDQYMFYEK